MRFLNLTRNRLVMLLFLALFLAPIFWVQLALQRGWLENTPRVTHHGVRMQPPVGVVQLGPVLELSPLTPDILQNHWWLVYILPQDCTDACAEQLQRMLQIKEALGQAGLQVMIADPGREGPEGLSDPAGMMRADFHWLPVSAMASNNALRGWIETSPQPTEAGHLYVMNPQGSLMMHYPPDSESEGILEDLVRLL